jgi:AraC family transcriptional regulator, exoenzyme S synthesis regulatory protein ExsA
VVFLKYRQREKSMILEQKEIKYKGKVVFERLVMRTQFKRVPKFFTENEACFMYLTKGAFQFRTPTTVLTFNEGDAMLSKCGNYFIENVSLKPQQEAQVLSALGAFFYPDMIKDFFKTDLSLNSFKSTFDTTKINVEPLLKAFIDSLNFLIDNPSVVDDNFVANKLKELLLILSKSENAASIIHFVNALFVSHEYDFNDIIQKNLYSNLSIPELAQLCNMSVATFKRKFTERYHESPAKYRLIQKLERAKQLIQIENKPVSDIAFDCGFENIPHFNKAFKMYFGQNPTAFRLSQNDK